MLSLLKLLTDPRPAPLSEGDARLALAALLVRVARADNNYDAAESAAIAQVLGARYGLSAPESQELREQAEALEASAPDTVRFTRAIKDAVAYEHRETVVEDLWQVALADGSRDAGEDSLMRLVVNLLGVNDRDSALARQRVETRQS